MSEKCFTERDSSEDGELSRINIGSQKQTEEIMQKQTEEIMQN